MVQESIYDRLFSQHTESFSAKVRDPLGWESSLHMVEPETPHPKEKKSKPVQGLPPKTVFTPEPVPVFEPESEREAKPEREPEPEPERIRETGPEPVQVTELDESEREDKPVPEPETESVHGPLSDPTLEPTPVPEPDSQYIHVPPHVLPTPDAIFESEPEGQPESILEAEIDMITEHDNETDPDPSSTESDHQQSDSPVVAPASLPSDSSNNVESTPETEAVASLNPVSEPEAQPESILETEIDTITEPENMTDPEEDTTLLPSSTESDHQQSDSPIVAPASLPSDSSHSVDSTPETEVVAPLNPARKSFKLFCSSKYDKTAALHELSIHELNLRPAFAAYEAGTQSSQTLARDIITALFARDHMEGKHWDYDTATTRRPSLAEDVNPNEGEAWYAEKEATWDWKDIYSVATAKGTIRFLPNQEKVQVEQYSFYAAG
eukprot:scaffold421231_cov58-Attheya_sp.AAC.1